MGGGRRALEAGSAGAGRLCSGPALDNRPDQGRRMAAEHLRPAGIRWTSAGPTFTGGSRGGSVCHRQAVSDVSRGHQRTGRELKLWISSGNATAEQNPAAVDCATINGFNKSTHCNAMFVCLSNAKGFSQSMSRMSNVSVCSVAPVAQLVEYGAWSGV